MLSKLAPEDALTENRTPLMSWSQTPSAVTIVVSVRTSKPLETTIAFATSTLNMHIRIDGEPREYTVCATWFADVVADACQWKRQGNGDVRLTVPKAQTIEWSHPFADRAYKGFVRIDWSRWENEVCVDSEEDVEDLGALSSASPLDFGGSGDTDFPSESNSEFQDLMKGLEKLGNNTDVAIPDLEQLKSMNTDQLKDFLKGSESDGCSEVDLDKVKETVAVNDEEGANHTRETTDDRD